MSSDKNYTLPKFCSYNISIKEVACGQSHTCLVTTNNFIYSMGSNEHGQLGIERRQERLGTWGLPLELNEPEVRGQRLIGRRSDRGDREVGDGGTAGAAGGGGPVLRSSR